VLADVPPDEILTTLSHLLETETSGGIFVTVCDVTIHRDLSMEARVAGHPPPLRCVDGTATYLDVVFGPPLGISDEQANLEWPVTRTELAPGSSLVLYTDGLLDAYRQVDSLTSVGLDELVAVTTDALAAGQSLDQLLSRVVGRAPLQGVDDTAMVVLSVGKSP
jgi:serine phosphatase RsbU (regulator of sigma subunit)